MANIRVLDQNTINKIAAGEVIERPASVVKELLENAIDATATAVTVEIRDGGTTLIRITDNGCGIPKDEIPLAFLRHATSKIQAVEDLFTVSSLGFRGEALASIAAVSQVELITKVSDSLTGFRYQLENGQAQGPEEIGAPDGTTIIARNLFFNTPARKKFLKRPLTEGAYVADLVEKIALSRPDLSLRLIQNGQNKLYTSGNNNLKDLVYTVYGREVAANLLPLEYEAGEIQISGFVGKPLIARGNRNYENYFINGRYIKSGIVYKAIEEAFKPFMMQHKYPFTLLHFTISPELLDVNVHPTKMELRFSSGEQIYQAIFQAVTRVLSHRDLIPSVTLEDSREEFPSASQKKPAPPEPFEVRRRQLFEAQTAPPEPEKTVDYRLKPSAPARPVAAFKENAAPSGAERAIFPTASESERGSTTETATMPEAVRTAYENQTPVFSGVKEEAPKQLELFDNPFLSPQARKRHHLIGQLFETYWLVEYDNQLIIIDQHAAHEKILYEKTMKALQTREFDTQMVAPPIILTLSMNEELMLKKYMDYFTGLGFEIEHFGGREYAVHGIPSNLFSLAKRELLIEMLDGLSEDASLRNPDMIYEKVASMSCKAAVKGNHALSAMEANELIDQLLALDNPYHCPHGRPVIISMSKYELEKKFKRIV